MSGYRDSEKPREKKSWRDIDKARDGGHRRERDERERNNPIQQNSSAYERYKANLEKMWANGGKMITAAEAPASMPEPMRAVLKKPSEEQQKEKELRDAMRKAVGPMEVKKAVEAYLQFRPAIPDDLELLSKAITSPTEAHQAAALRGLDKRTDLATNASARLLKTRLDTVLLVAQEDETKALAKSVRAKLG